MASAETPRRCPTFGEELLEPRTRSLERGTQRQQRRRRRPDPMESCVDDADIATTACRQSAHRANRMNLGDEARVENDLADAATNAGRVGRRTGHVIGNELDEDQIVRIATVDHRPKRGVARVAAIPVRLAVDDHCLIKLRQAR